MSEPISVLQIQVTLLHDEPVVLDIKHNLMGKPMSQFAFQHMLFAMMEKTMQIYQEHFEKLRVEEKKQADPKDPELVMETKETDGHITDFDIYTKHTEEEKE